MTRERSRMKKIIITAAIVAGFLGCGVAGYVMGSKPADILVEKEIAQIEADYQIQIEHYEDSIKKYEKEIQRLKAKKETSKEPSGSKEVKETIGVDPANEDYEYLDFEHVFGPFCTEDDLRVIKNEATRIVRESEYKNIKKIACSEYFTVDSQKGKVQTYARLDDKGVLELTYSVRFGKSGAAISKYSQKDLSDLEKYGRVMDLDSTETVTPYPNEEEK